MSIWHEGEAGRHIQGKDRVKAAVARTFIAASQAYREAIGEISLPRTNPEFSTPLSKETQKLVEHLRKDGYVAYGTLGASPHMLRSEGMPFSYVDPKLEDLSFSSSLVAFKPEPASLFLPGSKNHPYEKQQEILEEEKVRVEKKYPGAGLIVREGVEWPELSWQHFNATDRRVRLFGADYGFAYTWMPKYESNKQSASRAIAGRWFDQDGFHVYFRHPGYVDPHLRLASLVEIPRV